MSFNKWYNKNSSKLGIISLGYDLDKAWRASKTEEKSSLKRKILTILKRDKERLYWAEVLNKIKEL